MIKPEHGLVWRSSILALAVFFGVALRVPAQDLDWIGLATFRAATTNLDGAGIRVGQPEANADGDPNHPSAFEVNPGVVGQPTNLFTYASVAGIATGFTNSVGKESGHANGVAANFYGRTGSGVATNVAHVDNFDADYFVNFYIVSNLDVLADAIVNQSFTFGNVTNAVQTNGIGPISVGDQQVIDALYDDYAAFYGTLFVSAVNNQYAVSPPGTAYNSIGVAAYGGSSSIGPTLDNGRCKPDLTAPNGVTSFSTPYVSGAAAVLMQAALRGDGGPDTNAAADLRVLKALLLNGAVKPVNWTNSNVFPLDARYGAGVLNVFNSYRQLAGGKQVSSATNLVGLNADHPPVAAANTVAVNQAWDFAEIASGETNDAVVHYFFDVTNVIATVTLAWNRQLGAAGVNDLDLYLYRCADSNEVASSISYVNNVEHLYVTNLAAGRYDLQVVKYGGTNVVSDAETYAVAWQFVPPPALSAARMGTNTQVNWPLYPAGFCVEARTNLLAGPAWSTNGLPASVITDGQNSIRLNMTDAAQFFRLRQPNF
jgi:hypothetical protein